jgi:hypothetical protein
MAKKMRNSATASASTASKKNKPELASLEQAAGYVANPAQVGGIEMFSMMNGPGCPNRVAMVNTGSGLNYKVVIDRGLDIADAFYKGMSLSWLSLSGINRPEMSRGHGLDWLWGFYGGLLVSCGPSSAGAPGTDQGQEIPLHGRHSNLSATVGSIMNPDPLLKKTQMSISGVIREAKLFEPNIELQRTIRSEIGKSIIEIEDTFINRGTQTTEHAWLLHMNLGYPLIEKGAEFMFRGQVNPLPSAKEYFEKRKFNILPAPMHEHDVSEAVAYIDPKTDRDQMVHCGVINAKRRIGLKISFSKRDFPRLVNWQHFGTMGQYVMGIEPANCGVEGRAKDRERGWLKFLKPGEKKNYRCTVEVLEGKEELDAFRKLLGK